MCYLHQSEISIHATLVTYYYSGILYNSFRSTDAQAPRGVFKFAFAAVPTMRLTTISFGSIGGQTIATYSPWLPALSRLAFCILDLSNPLEVSFSCTCSKRSRFP